MLFKTLNRIVILVALDSIDTLQVVWGWVSRVVGGSLLVALPLAVWCVVSECLVLVGGGFSVGCRCGHHVSSFKPVSELFVRVQKSSTRGFNFLPSNV